MISIFYIEKILLNWSDKVYKKLKTNNAQHTKVVL